MNAAQSPAPSAGPSLLVTGGTGLLGSYLVRDLLQAGRSLALLVRRDRKRSAAARVEALVRHWEDVLDAALPRPGVLEGDLSQPFCGLSEEDRHWVHWNCSELLNNAARRLLNLASTTTLAELDAYGAAFQRDLAQSKTGDRTVTRMTSDGVQRHLIVSTSACR